VTNIRAKHIEIRGKYRRSSLQLVVEEKMRLGIEKIVILVLFAAGNLVLPQSNSDSDQSRSKPAEVVPKTIPKLSPGAAYREAVRPIEVTHKSIANWSDIEQASLAIAVERSAMACAERSAVDYSGDSLIDLSRLCATGLLWPKVLEATTRYLNEEAPKTHAAEAYAAKINAELELNDQPSALRDGNTMLDKVPYDKVVADSSSELINYLELLYTNDAVAFASRREVHILQMLQASRAVDSSQEQTASMELAPTLTDLYQQGLVLARLQQLAGHPDAASETIARLDKTLPVSLTGDDLAAIQGMRGQYSQLGQPLSIIAGLGGPAIRDDLSLANGEITVLLLFPDWCAQGIRLAQKIPKGEFSVDGYEARMYALLVKTFPAKRTPHSSGNKPPKELSDFNPTFAAEYLKGTPSFTVSPALIERFYAIDVPLLIIADSNGVVRLIEVADETVLQPGKTVDSAVVLIGKQWQAPRQPPKDGHRPSLRNHPEAHEERGER
jgi:hypothetical protein